MKKRIVLLGLIVSLFSCDVAKDISKQVIGAYEITQCRYLIENIVSMTLAGINLQNVKNVSSLNPLAAANLLAAFASPEGSLPLNFTLNLGVTNPGTQAAILNSANYILQIDGLEMTQGAVNKQLSIGAGQKATLPINIGFDLKKAMSGKSLDAIKNLAFNFAGIGNANSNVTLKLKPSISVNGNAVSSPDYIPISLTLNKK
jgi:hypothetical protein